MGMWAIIGCPCIALIVSVMNAFSIFIFFALFYIWGVIAENID